MVSEYKPKLLQTTNMKLLEATALLGNKSWMFKASQLEEVLRDISKDIAFTLSKSHGAMWIGVYDHLGNRRQSIFKHQLTGLSRSRSRPCAQACPQLHARLKPLALPPVRASVPTTP